MAAGAPLVPANIVRVPTPHTAAMCKRSSNCCTHRRVLGDDVDQRVHTPHLQPALQGERGAPLSGGMHGAAVATDRAAPPDQTAKLIPGSRCLRHVCACAAANGRQTSVRLRGTAPVQSAMLFCPPVRLASGSVSAANSLDCWVVWHTSGTYLGCSEEERRWAGQHIAGV